MNMNDFGRFVLNQCPRNFKKMPSDDALTVFDKVMIIVRNLFSVSTGFFSTVFIILFHNLVTEAQ